MRIIKRGEEDKKETEITCHRCKTIFAYVTRDTKADRDGYYVECPLCDAFVAIKR